jgi:hypothetical protein
VSGLLALLAGCQAPEPQSQPYQYYATRIVPASRLRNYAIEPHGPQTVFVVTYQYGDSATNDSGLSEILTFAVDSSARQFSLKNQALRASGAFYEMRCMCRGEGMNEPRPVGQGYAQGTRLGPGTWLLDVAVFGMQLQDTVRLGSSNRLDLNILRPR